MMRTKIIELNSSFCSYLVKDRVGFSPWQKLFLPGRTVGKKTVKTVVKNGKNSRISFYQ